jgi:hypothetical protein
MRVTRLLLCYGAVVSISFSERCLGGLEVAHRVYAERLAGSPPGVYAIDDLLFVIAEVPREAASDGKRLQAKCMLQSLALLRDFAAQQSRHTDGTRSFFQRLPTPAGERQLIAPASGGRGFRFTLSSRVLVDTAVGTKYRYAIAISREEFESRVFLSGGTGAGQREQSIPSAAPKGSHK